jgi:hypothetical protein
MLNKFHDFLMRLLMVDNLIPQVFHPIRQAILIPFLVLYKPVIYKKNSAIVLIVAQYAPSRLVDGALCLLVVPLFS